jgi:DNA-binding response OmpR family regulator
LLPILLERAGYPVRHTRSLALAQAWVDRDPPGLILHSLDHLAEPQIRFCRSLKQARTTADIEVLLLVPSPDALQLDLMHSLGLQDYVTKPFLYPKLLEKIRSLAGEGKHANTHDRQ